MSASRAVARSSSGAHRGYPLVECASFDRATEIAARFVNPDAEGEYVDGL